MVKAQKPVLGSWGQLNLMRRLLMHAIIIMPIIQQIQQINRYDMSCKSLEFAALIFDSHKQCLV